MCFFREENSIFISTLNKTYTTTKYSKLRIEKDLGEATQLRVQREQRLKIRDFFKNSNCGTQNLRQEEDAKSFRGGGDPAFCH